MTDTRNKAVIEKSKSKKQPFKLSFIGKNGEPISSAELFTTKWNCEKNIDAHIKFFDADRVTVVDLTGKKERIYERWYPADKDAGRPVRG